ncbi:uncharacterized protein LOC107426044 [Ziziphus jujuba]|uniref:Uncharacterized protein LOC107426044 n=1 Tax=Ziziphus jujuba TaxID=326968 RepID=A0A6P4A7C7_ZIZJJ|nr:uncharacterized protein LOC107426044 [Ziziphus jujuba]
MDMKKKVVDVSTFLLFEATGDSDEADSNCVDSTMVDRDADHCDIVMGEDDAESCSWDLSDAPTVLDHELINGGDRVEEYVYDDDGRHREEEEQEDDDDDDDVVKPVYQAWGGNNNRLNHQKSCVSVDSTREFELLNEMEKNRIFWETCLAS